VIRALRRTISQAGLLLLVPLVVLLEAASLLEGRRLLGTNWVTTAQLAQGSAPIIVVLAIVVGGVGGVAWRRHWTMVETMVPRSSAYPMIPALASALVMSATHLVWVGAVLVLSRSPGSPSWTLVVAALVSCLAIVAGSLAGGAVGTTLNTWLTPPVAGLVAYAFLVWANSGWPSYLLSVGGVGEPLIGVRIRPEVLFSQLGWFLAVGLGSAWFVWFVLRRGRTRLLAVCGFLLPLAFLPVVGSLGGERYELDDPAWACSGEDPRFCVLDQDAPRFAALEPRYREAVRRLDDHGATGSDQVYWQRLSISPPDHHREFSLPERSRTSDREIVNAVVQAVFPCVDDWTYEDWESADRLIELVTRVDLGVRGPAADGSKSVAPTC